ncbi:SusC/RagA family TonB-linked outer membrane protein [Chitinophaga alhagiae]|nr:SusC/RagA family TonB-linked outer membrane protein [Chitinophaga alhagiae]
MRLTVLLIIAGCLRVSAASYAQSVSVSLKNVPLEEVFATVKQQTGFLFFYDRDMLTATKPVTIKARNQALTAFLAAVFSNQPLDYAIKDKTIFLKRKPVTAPETPQQAQPLTGTVKDQEGQVLIGVSIKVKGTTKGVVTDVNGKFSINAGPGDVLVLSYIGFEPYEVQVSNQGPLTLVMKPAVSALDEAVIIGYGTTIRRKNTGSISTVQSKDIADQPVLDPLAALQGRVSGLMITSSNGLPGSSFNVMLRGRNSILGATDPLYIVDGVPFVTDPLNQFNSANGTQSPLASISPDDIERIDILKDADATAIYGSRAGNGVILITTKKGKAGQTRFNLNVTSGGSKVANLLDMLNTQQYLEMRREAFANDGKTPDENTAPDLVTWDQNANTNWQKMMIGNTANFTNVSASLSGGTEQTRFLFSGTYDHQTTVMPNSLPFRKAGSHFSLDHTGLGGKFKATLSANYNFIQDKSIATDLTGYYNLAPNFPIYDSTGKYFWFGNSFLNPVAMLHRTSDARTSSLIANSTLRYTILPGLNAKVSLGYTKRDMKQVQAYPLISQNPQNTTGSFSYFGNSDLASWIVEPQIDYTRQISKGELQLLAGATWQGDLLQGERINAENFVNDGLLEDIKSAGRLTPISSTYNFYRYTSGFGRITYNWDGKYIVNASFRRDGSTRFGPDNRFGNFGAVGAAWVFSEENFLRNNQVLSYGKLRASAGVTGSDRIGNYQYLESWSSTSYPYDGTPGLTPARLPNGTYRWEETRKLEAALELGFLQDKLLFNTNFYRNVSSNMLVAFMLSPQVGFTEITDNFPAKVLNTGWEFDLTSVNIRRKDFEWRTMFNLSFNRNELMEYPGIESSTYKDVYVVGKSLSIVKGFRFGGIDPETGKAIILAADPDSPQDPDDYNILGKTMPDFFGGLQNTFSYKGLELDVLFQFVKQEGPLLNYGYLSQAYGTIYNKDISALGRWRQKGDQASVPMATTLANNSFYDYYRVSSGVWGDASFIRLKNIALRYNLSKVLSRYKVNNLSVILSGQNLLTITSYDGFDPETQGLRMPPMKTITAGLKLTL